MTKCPDRQQLAAFLADELPAADRNTVAQHVAGCATCISLINESAVRPGDDLSRERNPRRSKVADRAPSAVSSIDRIPDESRAGETTAHASAGAARGAQPAPQPPAKIGRYEIRRRLGRGGFGEVYLAHDTQLDRLVAIKVPNEKAFDDRVSSETFLREARNAAKVNHPRLVTVYDAQNDNGRIYVVQEYVDGSNLSEWMKTRSDPVAPIDAVELILGVAEALAAIHAAGLVHRDLKPANILLDSRGEPRVADFGLALQEIHLARYEGEVSGTPRFMSPEQVRGETHLLDGRTDLWSLGVILYELLVGARPFHGHTVRELFRDIQSRDPRPLSMVRPQASIDAELERICLKCLRKRSSDRYASASRLMDDLQHWLDANRADTEQQITPPPADMPTASATVTAAPVSRIVPKGLRAFDAGDADFFLELLPGPRDRDGLPESLRFWKQHIEETDGDETFRVGLIYGPSGCGKSSLVKAGLIPRLRKDRAIPVLIDATPDETELRLRRAFAKRCSVRTEHASLPDIVRELRERTSDRSRIVVIIDQFEQWLHAHREHESSELVNALRQCDGGRVQCILMVRDDFWMAISQFMHQLEIPIESSNSAAVDLFDLPHASRVLTELGRAFGRLPPDPSEDLSSEQEQFVAQAVNDLSSDGRIVCVRLSLFADMMKGRPWTPDELRKVGGTEGVGATFLEETFAAATAPPQHRVHQQAARRVLAALLPSSGADIKGHMRSHEELRDVAGYADRPTECDELLNILDRDVRLITPTDPDAIADSGESSTSVTSTDQTTWYQLTHDYLVPSLREWLHRKQKETRRGRARLQLAERTELWIAKQESRQLPGLFEYLSLKLLTDHSQRTDNEQHMLRSAGRFHTLRTVAAAALIFLLCWAGLAVRARSETRALVNQLATAKPTEVGGIAERLQPHMQRAAPLLRTQLQQPAATQKETQQQLHARIALAATDADQVEPLTRALLVEHPDYVGVITDALRPYQADVRERLWSVLSDGQNNGGQRFRAALALANYDPDSSRWDEFSKFVVEELVEFNPEHQPQLRGYLRPIKHKLLPDLERVFRDRDGADTPLLASASAVADYIADDAVRLADLLVEATPRQYETLWPHVAHSTDDKLVRFLDDLIRRAPAADLDPVGRVTLGKRRAGAAITRIRLGGRGEVLPVFQATNDRESATQFVHRLRALAITPDQMIDIFDRLRGESPTVRYAATLALGEFALAEIPEQHRRRLIDRLANDYENDPSSAVHSASGWLLRQWGQQEIAETVDQTPRPYSREREWFNVVIETQVPVVDDTGDEDESTPPRLAPAKFSLTFVVFQPGRFQFGSPKNEPGKGSDEEQHEATLTRPFAVLDREITFAEILACQQAGTLQYDYQTVFPGYGSNMESAAMAVSWYDAVRFCRWLTEASGLSESDQCYADPQGLDADKFPIDDRGKAPRNWPIDRSKRGYRLPTEHEWEVAARSGTSTMYEFGSDPDLVARYGWYVEPSKRQLHAPRTLRPSSRGLFDMHGNVWEWCHDWYTEEPFKAGTVDPIGPAEAKYRVYRGGGWAQDRTKLRSADRRLHDPITRGNDLGFRVIVTLPE